MPDKYSYILHLPHLHSIDHFKRFYQYNIICIFVSKILYKTYLCEIDDTLPFLLSSVSVHLGLPCRQLRPKHCKLFPRLYASTLFKLSFPSPNKKILFKPLLSSDMIYSVRAQSH